MQLIVNIIVLAAIYALLACGYVLIIILMIRPYGLFGTENIERL